MANGPNGVGWMELGWVKLVPSRRRSGPVHSEFVLGRFLLFLFCIRREQTLYYVVDLLGTS